MASRRRAHTRIVNGRTVRVSETTVNTSRGNTSPAASAGVADKLRAQAQAAANEDRALAYMTMDDDTDLNTGPAGGAVYDTSGPDWEDDYSTPPPPGAVYDTDPDRPDSPEPGLKPDEFAAFEDAFNEEFVDPPAGNTPLSPETGPRARGRGRGRQGGLDHALRAMATTRGASAQSSQPGGLKFNPDNSIFGRLFKGLGGNGR